MLDVRNRSAWESTIYFSCIVVGVVVVFFLLRSNITPHSVHHSCSSSINRSFIQVVLFSKHALSVRSTDIETDFHALHANSRGPKTANKPTAQPPLIGICTQSQCSTVECERMRLALNFGGLCVRSGGARPTICSVPMVISMLCVHCFTY